MKLGEPEEGECHPIMQLEFMGSRGNALSASRLFVLTLVCAMLQIRVETLA